MPTMFQPSPNLKAGCNPRRRKNLLKCHEVSTLTQPQGRVQHCTTMPCPAYFLFQPSPNLKAGCNFSVLSSSVSFPNVSTLTQPQGRVQPYRSMAPLSSLASFNPHPTSRPGATLFD